MPHRERFLAAWLNPNVTMDALSRRYGVSDYTVKSWAEKMGLPPRIAREARG
jgi:transposase-like protein